MPATEQVQMPALGEQGEPCSECGAPLASDQRYCINCGARRGAARLDASRYLGGAPAAEDGATPPPADPRLESFSPMGAVLGVAVLGAMLLIGVLIGRGDGDEGSAAPQIVTAPAGTAVAGDAGSGNTETASATQVKSEWPDGKSGWTVELGTLPKDTDPADVEAARADAESEGAPDVGVLESDLYASLPAGNYVVYSGVFDSEGDADKALSDLKGDFPDAKVIEVTDEQSGGGSEGGGALLSGANKSSDAPVQATEEDIAALDDVTGQDYQDALKNLPEVIETPGEKAPLDPEGEVGGGTEAEVIE